MLCWRIARYLLHTYIIAVAFACPEGFSVDTPFTAFPGHGLPSYGFAAVLIRAVLVVFVLCLQNTHDIYLRIGTVIENA